jgi:hypothetical protein
MSEPERFEILTLGSGQGAEAGEVTAAVQTAMLAGLTYQRLRDAVITHLTYAEGLGPLLSNLPPR